MFSPGISAGATGDLRLISIHYKSINIQYATVCQLKTYQSVNECWTGLTLASSQKARKYLDRKGFRTCEVPNDTEGAQKGLERWLSSQSTAMLP